MIKVKMVPTARMGASFTVFFRCPSLRQIIFSSLEIILKRVGTQEVGPRRKSYGPLLAIWRVKSDAKGNLNSANFLIVVRPLHRVVVDFTAPRDACEMMINLVRTLDPRKDRKGLTPVELDTRLAAGAGHLKNTPALAHVPPMHQAHREPTHNSALFTFILARNARRYNYARSIGFCAMWVCISASSSHYKWQNDFVMPEGL
jgi:hypothetical protein